MAQIATEPRPAPPAPTVGWASLLFASAAHLLLFYLLDWFAHGRLLANSGGLLHLLQPERRQLLVDLALADNSIARVAMLSLPVVVLIILLRWRSNPDPLGAVGLAPSRGCFPNLAVALLVGLFAHFALQATAVVLGGGTPAGVEYLIALVLRLRAFASFGWLGAVALPVTAMTYAAARLAIPIGHLPPLLRRRLPPGLATLFAGLLFAAPYALSVAITPLLFANLWLLGLVAERLTARTGSLWPAVGLLGGWVALGELSPLPHQATRLGVAPFVQGPALLHGGLVGPEGGLVMTLLMTAALAVLLRGRR